MNDDLLNSLLSIKFNGEDPNIINQDLEFIEEVENHWKEKKTRYYLK